jgi:hypothetical protein
MMQGGKGNHELENNNCPQTKQIVIHVAWAVAASTVEREREREIKLSLLETHMDGMQGCELVHFVEQVGDQRVHGLPELGELNDQLLLGILILHLSHVAHDEGTTKASQSLLQGHLGIHQIVRPNRGVGPCPSLVCTTKPET